MLYYVISCYVMLCYVKLCFVMLCYIMLCYVILCLFCYVMLYHVMLYYVISCNVVILCLFCYFMLYYVISCYVMLRYVLLRYVMLYYVMLYRDYIRNIPYFSCVFPHNWVDILSRNCSGSEDIINVQELKMWTDEGELNNVTRYGNVLAERTNTNTYAGARTHVHTHTQRNLITRRKLKHNVKNNKKEMNFVLVTGKQRIKEMIN